MSVDTNTRVEHILTSILQWSVSWLAEQRVFAKPPPVCRAESKKLKITYENYRDYESTFVPLLMHEIWAQIFEEWTNIENESSPGEAPMDVDDSAYVSQLAPSSSSTINPFNRGNNNHKRNGSHKSKQFWVGVADYKTEGQYQCILKCQALIESNQLNNHLKLIGEGDLVIIDLILDGLVVHQRPPPTHQPQNNVNDDKKPSNVLSLFGYVVDVQSEKLCPYTHLAECFVSRPNNKSYFVVNYSIAIAKRPLRLKLSEPMKISCIYYLKPMIRQIESVIRLQDSTLAKDILSPKLITCQLSIPTIVSIHSQHYNDMQYKAIIGTNEALVRSIPKIQLIQGPPGTGKTHTLIGIIKHFYSKWPDHQKLPKILICAPSNGAIDEVVRRLYAERGFLKKTPAARSLRLVRVGHPDQISDTIKHVSLDQLVETNAKHKVNDYKQKYSRRTIEIEKELASCDTEISNLRYTNRTKEIPTIELKIRELLLELDRIKTEDELKVKREVSDANKRNIRFELIKNADVILTTLNSCQRHPLDMLFRSDRTSADLSFHCVIVDEASQCCEPELLMPLCYNISKMILIGDPMQLPATVISRHAQEFDFGRSLFERFFLHFGKYNKDSPIAMLTDQYRMHPSICWFPSRQFYNCRLVSAKSTQTKYPLKPYIMFDLRNSAESKSSKNGTSLENHAEADLVRNLLVAVTTIAPENSKIGVITPYKGQKRLITNKISNLITERNINIDINTCDGFQGQEKDIIILSCVRAFESGNSIGFLRSTQRMNVSLTRAKHCLIVVISIKSLSKDKSWLALAEDASKRRVVNVLTHTPSSLGLMQMLRSTGKDEVIDLEVDDDETQTFSRTNLIPARESTTNKNEFVPELIMPMDID